MNNKKNLFNIRNIIIIIFCIVFIFGIKFENKVEKTGEYTYEVNKSNQDGVSLINQLNDDFDQANTETMVIADNWISNGVFYSTWRKNNVIFKDGVMSLVIDKDQEGGTTPWSSAEYFTVDFTQYGDYSVRMKPIKNDGIISAFFVYTGPGYGYPWDEIDIEFLGDDTSVVQFNYYTNGVGKHEYVYHLGFDASDEFHTYGFIWREDYIVWTVDNEEVYRATEDIPSNPAKIMMNAWVTQGIDSWAGKFDGKVPLAAEYDWIKYKAIDRKY